MPLRQAVLVDTGFLFALFDPRDQHHLAASVRESVIAEMSVLLPWPVLYEALNTRFIKREQSALQIEALFKRPNVEILCDTRYRSDALETALQTRVRRPLSLVDIILRQMIEAVNISTSALLTFNPGDFADLCVRYNVELLCQSTVLKPGAFFRPARNR